MNRAEETLLVLKLESAAKQLAERAKQVRARLDADARAELEQQGTAPTWRLPDIGTWSLPVSKETAYVANADELLAWVKYWHPTEVETTERVRPAFVSALLAESRGDADGVVWMREGALVPGLAWREGGVPKTLQFRPSSDALAVVDQQAAILANEMAAALGVEKTDAP